MVFWVRCMPPAGLGVVAATLVASALVASDAAAEDDPAIYRGILPSLSAAWNIPENLKLRYPDVQPVDGPVTYPRRFPIGGQAALDRGFVLPEPFGLSVIGVNSDQEQNITDLEVALGRADPPPPDTPLVPIPFVALENVISQTQSVQIKADVWVLPNVNVFTTVGHVTGDVDLDVVIDPADVLPPAACPPTNPCDPVRAAFTAGVDTITLTFGASAVYGWDNWFTTGSLAGTITASQNAETLIRSISANARFGRRWAYGPGHILAPYIGVNYLDLDQIVEGVTRLNDAFPNGDSLEVRYKAQIENIDKVALVLGVNFGFVNGVAITGEYTWSPRSERILLAATYRF